jgi:hypothetical protein
LLARSMDAEFIIVDADDDRLSPFDQFVVLIKACGKNQRASRLCQACNPRVQGMIRANLKTLEVQLAKRDREIREINATVRGSPLWRAAGA